MNEFVDPGVIDLMERLPLPENHPAARLAARLPGGHPVKELFEGVFQWIAHLYDVREFFRVFEEIHGDILEKTGVSGLLHVPGRLEYADLLRERDAFLRMYPEHDDHAIVGGKRHRLRQLLGHARGSIDQATSKPWLRIATLDAFDQAFAKLVRAVRSA